MRRGLLQQAAVAPPSSRAGNDRRRREHAPVGGPRVIVEGEVLSQRDRERRRRERGEIGSRHGFVGWQSAPATGPAMARATVRQRQRDEQARPEQNAIRHVPERHQQQAQQRVDEQDVAPPQQVGMQQADQREYADAAQVETQAIAAARRRALHLQREAEPEQQREQRDRLAVDEQVHGRQCDPVERRGRQRRACGIVEVFVQGERRQVDHQYACQCEPAQGIDQMQALLAGTGGGKHCGCGAHASPTPWAGGRGQPGMR